MLHEYVETRPSIPDSHLTDAFFSLIRDLLLCLRIYYDSISNECWLLHCSCEGRIHAEFASSGRIPQEYGQPIQVAQVHDLDKHALVSNVSEPRKAIDVLAYMAPARTAPYQSVTLKRGARSGHATAGHPGKA